MYSQIFDGQRIFCIDNFYLKRDFPQQNIGSFWLDGLELNSLDNTIKEIFSQSVYYPHSSW